MIPIKLMKSGDDKKALLGLKNETETIDRKDFLEKKIVSKKNRRERDLMAIEDASEVAKWYLQQKGLYEKIARDLKKEAGVKFSFLMRKTIRMTKEHERACDLKFVLVEDEDHYGMIVSDKKGVQVYDSMGKETFMSPASVMFKNKIPKKCYVVPPLKDKKGTTISVQPTGGTVSSSMKSEQFHFWRRNPDRRRRIFHLHHLDELSQHHFCYVEAFVVMFKQIGLTKGGPADPRDRLPWIKRVIWAIILKNTPQSKRKGPEWEYFTKNFKYYLKTRKQDGTKLLLDHGASMQMPVKKVKYTIENLDMDESIDSSWTYKKIMEWV